MAKEQYLVLARKWRPQRFEDVVGQSHITRTLQNSIAAGRVGHAFLFIGSRGIGKTTTARILAKALNCESAEGPTAHPCCECDNCRTIAEGSNIDVVEIDGASNNSVEDVRQIRENVRLVPSRSRFKVYVIDEVHQLSISAFNALLKTLEEPPPHAVFILATTEAHKVPATIISRCQRYDFRRVGIEELTAQLRRILETGGMGYSDEALYAIARAAEGGVRDSQSILEQLMSYCEEEITFQDVFHVLGLVDWQVLHELCDAVETQDIAKLLGIVNDIVVEGKDLSQFVQDALQYFRNLLICKTGDPRALLALPEGEVAAMEERAARFSLTGLIRLVEQFAELTKDFDSQLAQRIALETLLIRLSKVSVEVSVDSVLEKLAALGAGGFNGPASEAAPPPGAAAPTSAHDTGSQTDKDGPPANPKPPPEREPRRETGPAPIEVTADNAARFWPRILKWAQEEALSLGVWLNQAESCSVDGDALVLTFAADHGAARDYVERADAREKIETALTEHTSNLRRVRTLLAEPVAPDHDAEALLDHAREVDEETLRRVTKLPQVAVVLDKFKGRIVAVRRD
jgi:DNA polymerase-3 subunit gamma/tau